MALLIISLNWFWYLILGLILIGVILYLVNNLLPIDPTIKKLINALVAIGVIVYLVYLFIQLKPF